MFDKTRKFYYPKINQKVNFAFFYSQSTSLPILKGGETISTRKNAHDKLLEVTERLFAEKGYDGTRVDEIANQAGVNKALIYYYFNNKRGILKALVKKHVEEVLQYKETLLEEIENYTKAEVRTISRRMFKLLEEKNQILSILTSEAIKTSPQDKDIFEFFHPIFEKTISHLKETGYQLENPEEKLLSLFFFGIIPTSIFLVLREKWADYYKMETGELSEIFQNKMDDFYLEFYRDIMQEANY